MKKSKPINATILEKKTPVQEISFQHFNHLLYEVQNQTILIWNYKGLKNLPPSLIQEASHIQQIYLKHNLLCKLPDNLGCLQNLTYLYLYGNNIEELPDSIGEIKTLNILDVSNNKLKSLNPAVSKLTNLRSLVIANNELTCIPSAISDLKALSLLILTGNRLLSLPESLGNCRALQGLYIDNNLMQILPHSLVNLSLLAHLSCCHNYLVNLPSKPFISQPTLFFDNNQELNYLPFSLLQDLKIGDFYNPYVVPSCGCFLSNPIKNRTVVVCFKKLTENSSVLHLPLQLLRISCYRENKTLNVAPLLELCLRYIWKKKNNYFNHILEPGILPLSLAHYLDEGPVIFCEHCKKNTIFLYASLIAISVKVTSQRDTDGKEVPIIIYFCSDFCAHAFVLKVNTYVDDYGLWLQQCLSSPLNVKIAPHFC